MKKKRKQNKTFVLLILVIFVLSTVGSVVVYYGGSSSTITKTYPSGKFKFEPKTDTFGNQYFEVSGKDKFMAYYLPDTLFLNMDKQSKDTIMNAPYFYLSFDPNGDLSMIDFLRFDIRTNIAKSKFFYESVTLQKEGYTVLPVADCRNATATVPVVILRNSTTTSVSSEGSCVTINYAQNDIIRIRDSIVYLTYGIDIN